MPYVRPDAPAGAIDLTITSRDGPMSPSVNPAVAGSTTSRGNGIATAPASGPGKRPGPGRRNERSGGDAIRLAKATHEHSAGEHARRASEQECRDGGGRRRHGNVVRQVERRGHERLHVDERERIDDEEREA